MPGRSLEKTSAFEVIKGGPKLQKLFQAITALDAF